MTTSFRILAVLGSRVLYGMERANIEVFDSLKTLGCQILVVVEDHESFQVVPQELSKRGIDFVPVPFGGRRVEGYLLHFLLKNPFLFLLANWRILKLIRSFRPTHILIPNPLYFLNCILALNVNKTPVIYRVGDDPSPHNFFWRWLWRRIIARVDYFVSDSKFIKRRLQQLGVPDSQITAIYSTPTLRKRPPQPERIPTNFQQFLYIGQIGAHKGVDRLVEAFKCVANDFPKARLTIVGRITNWQGDEWARTLRDRTLSDVVLRERVAFPGETEDIFEYLADSAFLVVPSVCEEALGTVAIEAKAAARPSVIFPSGGLQELIESGVDGYICRDKSVQALEEGLRYYLGDKDRALAHGSNALASIKRLGINRFARSWMDVCESCFLNHCDLLKASGLSK